ncbi:TonB-dependent receptor [Hymenobacter swuensis]|uniref:Putative TonB-dependent outer membrane receptor protein n=1 Tax=Hymenobacter swuensis DY53 TaxID=1227739 RepID=W8F278_9BACT|nr:TonB-dependent receptor [Hymenobacter swuensis]AHJ96701.1 putative TonB-dependent outer membrane receptor protein [Hymenobacter swuensis DY53]
MTLRFTGLLLLGALGAGLPHSVQAQVRHTLTGTIRAAADGAPLPGATVAVPALGLGTSTDAAGAFSLTLPAGRHQLVISFIGYTTQTRDVNLTRNQRLSVPLASAGNELGEVVIEGTGTLEEKLRTPQMSVERLTAREAKLLPALFGEVDILKTLQLKPGVQNGGEGTSGLFVRGGSSDQNLVLVDDALVYNPSHLFGLFSVFNPDAVQSVDLYKGGFPAQYGGRLSSVIDVKMREGNREKLGVSGGLGLISSRLTVEGPLGKRAGKEPAKGSFLVSGRRTYFDVFTRQINRLSEDNPDYNPIPDYYFYDFNAKANYTLGPKDQVFLSGYYGRDKFGFNSQGGFDFGFSWGNSVAAARWNHVFNPRLYLNTTASFTDYQYQVSNKLDQFSFNLGSNIRDYSLRSDLDYTPNERHALKLGIQATHHDFGVGRLQAGSGDGSLNIGSTVGYTGIEGALYASDNFRPSEKWQLEYGLRLTGFRSGSNGYVGLEPRGAARYSLSPVTSLKASYALMYQYVHLVTNSGATLPTDIWYPSRLSVKPQRSQQVATGVSFLLGEGKYLLSNELYYKWSQNQVDFKDGAQLFVNPDLDSEFLFGKGWAYGSEVYLEKKTGRTTGWIGYTLSWSKRQFLPQRGTSGINNGRVFYPNYDRRHNLTVVVLHQLTERLNLTGSFVYTTGNATTLPAGRFAVQDIYGENLTAVPIYPDRNSYRLAPYNRLDLGLVWKMKPTKWFPESDLTFSVYNAYNRRNPYFVYFDQVRAGGEDTPVTSFRARQVSLFPVIPSVTYNFKF